MLELLVVLALIGCITAFALPGYRRHLIRVHRTEAMNSLLHMQAAEESFYLRSNAYTDDITSAPPAGLGLVTASPTGYYTLSIVLADEAQGFIATATPTEAGGQSADAECLAFSIDEHGARRVSGSRDARSCWR